MSIGYQGQIFQDKIALHLLDHKREGTFLDIGCHLPMVTNNTTCMELDYGWSGIAMDIDCFYQEWATQRPRTKFICGDAMTVDWEALLQEHGMPNVIDFLSMDLEPPTLTWEAMKRFPFDKYRFNVIAYEHDGYRNFGVDGVWTRDLSRKLFMDHGYVLASSKDMPVHHEVKDFFGVHIHSTWLWTELQDDIWVHSSLPIAASMPLRSV